METNELYLKTAFCCMACDGDIAPEEMEKIKIIDEFKNLDIIHYLTDYETSLKANSTKFLRDYLNEIKTANLSEEEECKLAKIAVEIIEIDKILEYNEIAFFKKIRKKLKASDEILMTAIQNNPELIDKEDYFLPDLDDEDDLSLWDNDSFNNINIADHLIPEK